jgi:DNA-directed RNA polymerase specialized sigma24 family protein
MEIDWQKVEELAGKDLSQSEICLLLEIDEKKIKSTMRDTNLMADTIRRGRARSVLLVAEKLLEQCEKGNVSAITWWEKTRRGLADSVRGENEFESAAAAASEKLTRAIARLADAEEKKSARNIAAG